MKKRSTSLSGFFNLRILLGLVVLFVGAFLALFAVANPPAVTREDARNPKARVVRANGPALVTSSGVQEAWVARYNGPGNNRDEATDIAVDSVGNVYVTGRSTGLSGDFDFVTIKYNPIRQREWVARYNGPGNGDDLASAIAVDSRGNVYVTGSSSDPHTCNGYATIKYNPFGREQWVQRYCGMTNSSGGATAIALDNSDNVYVTGTSDGEYATIRYNSAGQQQWVARYNGPSGDDEARAIAIDASGNIYVTGYSLGPPVTYYYNYATVKYNSNGQQQWVARYNEQGYGDDYALGLAVDGSGNVYVTGFSTAANGFFDYATIKYDAVGQQQWAARYDGPTNFQDYGEAIAVDSSSNVYVTGQSYSQVGAGYATVKYNSTGKEQWVAQYNGPVGEDNADAIAIDNAANVYVTGTSLGLDTNYDYATIKYDSVGEEQWVARYNGPANDADYASAMAIDRSGNVYVTGNSFGSATEFDYATIKYVQSPTPTPTPSSTPTPRITPRPRPTTRPRPTPP